MVFLVGIFYWSDHFDQILRHTFSKKKQNLKMVHHDAHGLVKLTIYTEWWCLVKLATLIWLANLLAMPTKVPTYLFI
jgi:hypothetical protein